MRNLLFILFIAGGFFFINDCFINDVYAQKKVEPRKIDKVETKNSVKKIETQNVDKKSASSVEANRLDLSPEYKDGTQITPDSVLGKEEYYKKINDMIHENWQIPKFEIPGEMEVNVVLEIQPDGSVSEMLIVKESGSKEFDNSILDAIKKSNFPPIPQYAFGITKIKQTFRFIHDGKQ